MALLEKSFGIEAWLKLCGPEDAAVARDTAPQSLRAQYGSDAVKNGVHGSGSVAAAAREAAFFFGAAATALESTFALVKPAHSASPTPSSPTPRRTASLCSARSR